MSMKKHMKTMVRIMCTLTLLFAVSTVWAFAEDQAVEVKATDDQEESVKVNNDISTDTKDAVTVTADGDGSKAEAEINGDVESGEGHGVVVSADGGSASVDVKGDIKADEDGIDAKADNGGSVTVNVDGNVKSEEDGGIDAAADNGSSVEINVDGDVTSESESGLDLKVSGGAAIDVAVTGTIEGKESGIITNAGTPGCDGEVNVTAWKIKVNKDKDGKEYVALDYDKKINREFEKTINYIIKIKDPDYISLPGMKKGKYGYTAHEGEEILVKLDVPDGYNLKHVYQDEDRELEVIKGRDGNYYVKIPKGGGVILSVDIEKQRRREEEVYVKAAYHDGGSPKTGDKEELVRWIALLMTSVALMISRIKNRPAIYAY